MSTSLGQLAPDTVWRELLKGGRELEFGKPGHIVYESRKAEATRQWYVVVMGKVRVSVDKEQEEKDLDGPDDGGEEEDEEKFDIDSGEVFGGYWITENSQISDVSHIRVRTLEATKILELSGEELVKMMKEEGAIVTALLSRMGGKKPHPFHFNLAFVTMRH